VRTVVDGERYMFAADIEHDGLRTTAVVHWTAVEHGMQAAISAVRRFASDRVESKEVWFLYPADLASQHEAMCKLDEWDYRAPVGDGLNVRFFSVAGDGQWTEQETTWSAQGGDPLEVSEAVQRAVIADGLRQIFRESAALETASAGFHFARARSGRHSNKFLRTSQTVARTQHAYFVALALLSSVDVRPRTRLFVDTAGIAPAMYALKDLYRRLLDPDENITVESFGSYERFETDLSVRGSEDLVLISSSTSGSLAGDIVEAGRATSDRIWTLYYLADDALSADRGAVICDLTNRDEVPLVSVRDARIASYPTYSVDDKHGCDLCAQGSRTIELAGDGFFPVQDGLRLRMPVLQDRLLDGRSGREAGKPARFFDDSYYFTDFFGLDAIRAGRSVQEGEARLENVTTTIGHLLGTEPESAHIRERLKSKIKKLRAGQPPVSAVLSLASVDSRSLARFVAAEAIPGAEELESVNALVEADIATRSPRSLAELLPLLHPNTSVIVCAGVLGSGRALLSLSRDLRVMREDIVPLYLVGVTHPESDGLEQIFEGTIARRSAEGVSHFERGWRLPREPRSPGAFDSWGEEFSLLELVGKRLPKGHDAALDLAIASRSRQILKLRPDQLFVSSSFSGPAPHTMPPINPKFALWPEDWQHYPAFTDRNIVPSQAEVLATVAHLLHQSRRYSSKIDKTGSSVRRHGYALNPAIFDRFNDPQIQAAILRSVEPGELDYSADPDASRAIADIIDHVWHNIDNAGGEAAYEFVLSVARGRSPRVTSGLKLTMESLKVILTRAGAKRDFVGANPLTRALLLYIRGSVPGRLA
jgi:hypothetical protein